MLILLNIFYFFFMLGSCFDWIEDTINCYQYNVIAAECEYYLANGMQFEDYDIWKTSVIQNWEFNKQIGIRGGTFEWIGPSVYEKIYYKVTLYQQQPGMFSFWSNY